MISYYNVSQLRPLALCMQGFPLGYRSVSMLAKGEARGLDLHDKVEPSGWAQASSASCDGS